MYMVYTHCQNFFIKFYKKNISFYYIYRIFTAILFVTC